MSFGSNGSSSANGANGSGGSNGSGGLWIQHIEGYTSCVMIIVIIRADKSATNARPDGRAREPQLRPAIRSLIVLPLPLKEEFIVLMMADQRIRPRLCSDRTFTDEPERGSRARSSAAGALCRHSLSCTLSGEPAPERSTKGDDKVCDKVSDKTSPGPTDAPSKGNCS